MNVDKTLCQHSYLFDFIISHELSTEIGKSFEAFNVLASVPFAIELCCVLPPTDPSLLAHCSEWNIVFRRIAKSIGWLFHQNPWISSVMDCHSSMLHDSCENLCDVKCVRTSFANTCFFNLIYYCFLVVNDFLILCFIIVPNGRECIHWIIEQLLLHYSPTQVRLHPLLNVIIK